MSKNKARWQLLKNAVVDKKVAGIGDFVLSQSVRSFFSFNLFVKTKCNCVGEGCNPRAKDKTDCLWYAYTCDTLPYSKEIWVRHPDQRINLKEVTSFNNTGNVCIWPTEEVMAYYCISHIAKFHNKSIIELGGGSSSLAGMCVAFNSWSTEVVVTDGNSKCVDTLNDVIKMNKVSKRKELSCGPQISAVELRWDLQSNFSQYHHAFDFVLCSDCLFFDEYRQSLVDTIYYLLKPEGTALIFAPRRGNTFSLFVKICKEKFNYVEQHNDYSQHIVDLHEEQGLKNKFYNPDLHFPILLEIKNVVVTEEVIDEMLDTAITTDC
uniref:Calmodulin-lysine N-methyltransferase n=1 Tax=Ciona savignyi TaxID=51511 RepID=H2YLQ9_CIOSA